jgi:hypothetical protein
MTTTVSSGTRDAKQGTRDGKQGTRDGKQGSRQVRQGPPEQGSRAAAARGARPARADGSARLAAPARPALPPRPARPARPGRPARPARPASPPRSAPARRAAAVARDISGAGRRSASRTPFILLVLGLLAGGLICLLVINTTLAAASFRISDLQHTNLTASQRVQELQQQVATEQSPSSIDQRALKLGMRTQQLLHFVDLKTGRSYTMPSTVPGVYAVPGYTP